jgi:hypothetical protein
MRDENVRKAAETRAGVTELVATRRFPIADSARRETRPTRACGHVQIT